MLPLPVLRSEVPATRPFAKQIVVASLLDASACMHA